MKPDIQVSVQKRKPDAVTYPPQFCTAKQVWNSPPSSRATIGCFGSWITMVSHPLTTQGQYLGTTLSPQVLSSWWSEPVPSIPEEGRGGYCFFPDRTNTSLEKRGHIHRGLEGGQGTYSPTGCECPLSWANACCCQQQQPSPLDRKTLQRAELTCKQWRPSLQQQTWAWPRTRQVPGFDLMIFIPFHSTFTIAALL